MDSRQIFGSFVALERRKLEFQGHYRLSGQGEMLP